MLLLATVEPRQIDLPISCVMESSSHRLIGPIRLIDRIEYVRLIIQAISSLGYQNSASTLEIESCIPYKSPKFHAIESSALEGNWNDCIITLNSTQDLVGEMLDSVYLVLRQCFVQHVNKKEFLPALNILKDRMCDLDVERNKVERLSITLLTKDIEEIGFKKGCNIQNLRRNLVKDLNNLLPPQISFPRSRRSLEAITEDSILSSFEKCTYHNSCDEMSLYEHHTCYNSENQIPAKTIQVLTEHTEEVWMIKFSNGGDFLASTSSDVIFIWKVDEHQKLYKQHTIKSNEQVDFIAWSTFDSLLLVVGLIGAQI